MALLAVHEQGAQITARAEAIVVIRGGRALATKPSHEIDEVHVYGDVTLSAAARDALLRRGIDTLFFTMRGTYRGRLLGPECGFGARRAAQHQALQDPARALALARAFVAGKLRNQRALLLRARRDGTGEIDPTALAALRCLPARVSEVESVDSLRGLEGHGAAMYFRGFAGLIANPAFSFCGRNRRPPRDPINACLSFGYTLLLARVESSIRRAGLDPFVGALHVAERSKPALALDLMEELRPIVVDRLVARMINRRQLTPDDFRDPGVDLALISAPSQGEGASTRIPAVYLDATGREVFLREWGISWRTRHQYPQRDISMRLHDIVDLQAVQLAQVVEGTLDRYQPFVPR